MNRATCRRPTAAGVLPIAGDTENMFLIRHGQSEFNVAFAQTRTDPGIVDPGLTELGRIQALAAASLLSERGLVRLIASPYTRALQTASIIAEVLELPIEVQPVLGRACVFYLRHRVAHFPNCRSAGRIWRSITFRRSGGRIWKSTRMA